MIGSLKKPSNLSSCWTTNGVHIVVGGYSGGPTPEFSTTADRPSALLTSHFCLDYNTLYLSFLCVFLIVHCLLHAPSELFFFLTSHIWFGNDSLFSDWVDRRKERFVYFIVVFLFIKTNIHWAWYWRCAVFPELSSRSYCGLIVL